MPHCFLSRPACLALILIAVSVCGVTGIIVRREQRQHRLNRVLIRAILNYDTEAALALLRDGADPNTREQPDPTLPVWQQLRNILLRRKPPVNDSDPALVLIMDSTIDRPKQALTDNGIPRENACLVAALLDKGARINAPGCIGQTALGQALQWDYAYTTHILLAHGADVNLADSGGRTPLMAAADRGDEDIIGLLLKRGANLNAQDCIGRTALMNVLCVDLPPQILKTNSTAELLKYHMLPTALKVLLQHHPNLTLKNRRGETALAEARKLHYTLKVRLLMEAGAKE